MAKTTESFSHGRQGPWFCRFAVAKLKYLIRKNNPPAFLSYQLPCAIPK